MYKKRTSKNVGLGQFTGNNRHVRSPRPRTHLFQYFSLFISYLSHIISSLYFLRSEFRRNSLVFFVVTLASPKEFKTYRQVTKKGCRLGDWRESCRSNNVFSLLFQLLAQELVCVFKQVQQAPRSRSFSILPLLRH